MPVTSYTKPLTSLQAQQLKTLLKERGYEFSAKQYALFSATKGKLNVTVYEKGPKVLVQGKDTEEFVQFVLEPEILGEAELGYEEVNNPEMFTPHFGIDESGKGDFFGPLVVAGVYTNADTTRALMQAGIMDSKKITSHAKIVSLAERIREIVGVGCEVISISPTRYNEMYVSFANLNRLLAWGHSTVIRNLKAKIPDCPRALSDQFARAQVLESALKKTGVDIELQQKTKGESDIAVAAASILAREKFVSWMKDASERGGIELPLGASAAVKKAARASIEKHGQEILPKIAKMHFKTAGEL